MAKADCLNPNLQAGNFLLRAAIRKLLIKRCFTFSAHVVVSAPPVSGSMPSLRAIEGA